MKPVLVIKNARVSGHVRKIGKQSTHLKFNIIQDSSRRGIECLAFKMGNMPVISEPKLLILHLPLKKTTGKIILLTI